MGYSDIIEKVFIRFWVIVIRYYTLSSRLVWNYTERPKMTD